MIFATNSGGAAPATLGIRVLDQAPNISYSGSPFTFYRGVSITSTTPNNSGGTPTACTASPSLPAGLSLSAACVISGTPTALAGPTNHTITATNNDEESSSVTSISVRVNDIAPSISYTPTTYSWTKSTAITAVNAANVGGTIDTCTIVPAITDKGLAINGTTCAITGTPNAIMAATNHTVTATNSAGTSQVTLNLTIKDRPPTLAYNGNPFTFTNKTAITTINPINTGGTITSCSSNIPLPNGLALSATCVISGTPQVKSAATVYRITATNSGGSASTSINITVREIAPDISYAGSPLTYRKNVAISALAATNAGGAITSCVSSPSLPAGLSLSTDCTLSGTPNSTSAATDYTITATNEAGTDTATVSIEVLENPPAISYSGSPFVYTKDLAISTVTATNTGGPITGCVSAPALPTGLSLNTTTCAITGTPTAITANATYTITASNSGGNATPVTIDITVNDRAPSILYSGSPFIFAKNVAIAAATPTNSGGAITGCTSSPALPAGLSLNTSTCAITGTPTAAQAVTGYTITATNSGGSSAVIISITIVAAPALTYAGSPYTYTKGVPIATATPTNTGGTITSCSSSPALPAGLSLNSTTCAISGTATAISTATNYDITATNAGGSDTKTISITVNDAVPC
jgi:hypothetical protein